MDKKDVIEFFDKCSVWWDNDMVRNEKVIKTILDNSDVKKGVTLLDVACGTGVLFPDYLQREISSLMAIDISPKMVEIAKSKFPKINVICGDVENTAFDTQFDVVMLYNAFPHFANPTNLIEVLANLTKPNGKLCIAHGMSRESLLKHHERAKNVSLTLPTIDQMVQMFSDRFTVDIAISNDQMYQIVGTKKF